MSKFVEKVTGFVTCQWQNDTQLLLFKHPYAGIQIPAGTVEEGETLEDALLREVVEETGLIGNTAVTLTHYLGSHVEKLPSDQCLIAQKTKVYARPDVTSFDWAYLPRGLMMNVNRLEGEFTQVTYEEFDQVPDPNFVSMAITGWVPNTVLADGRRRHFYHLTCHVRPDDSWTVFTDSHQFTLFWASLSALPNIIQPQDEWLAFLPSSF